MQIPSLIGAAIETAFNHYLAMDPEAKGQLGRLHGRVIAIEVLGLGITLYLIPDPQRLQVLTNYDSEPDCTIRGTPLALTRLGNPENSSNQLFSGEVQINGNTELAHLFSKILNAVDIDWEEVLAGYTGDVVAHGIGQFTRNLIGWSNRSLNTLGMDLQEYLQEESRILPTENEITRFCSEVDNLRDSVERSEARIQRMTKTLKASLKGSA